MCQNNYYDVSDPIKFAMRDDHKITGDQHSNCALWAGNNYVVTALLSTGWTTDAACNCGCPAHILSLGYASHIFNTAQDTPYIWMYT